MNSSLQKALAASLLSVGGSMSAIGQGWDYDPHCVDPKNTAPYSTDFNSYYLETPLWSAGLGIAGTMAWKYCVPPSGGSVPVEGRFEFGPGNPGSIQDNLRLKAGEYDVSPDDYEDFQFGQNHHHDPNDTGVAPDGTFGLQSGSGWSFARIYTQSGTTTNSFLFGSVAMQEAFIGASNRYMFAQQAANNTTARLVIDVLGDTARFSWQLTNTGTAAINLGLWLGQWVVPVGGYAGQLDPNVGHATPVDNLDLEPGPEPNDLGWLTSNGAFQPYVLVPGLKPLQVDARFLATDPGGVPPYCDFLGGEVGFNPTTGTDVQTVSPQVSGGIQVVNAPYANVEDPLTGESDQTPVDEFDVGEVEFLMDGAGIQTNPIFNDITFSDALFTTGCCFVQKWNPTVSVPVGQYRDIVSYYRSIWGDSNYANGYTGVVDSPKVIAASQANPAQFDPNPYDLRVIVDNTGGFGQIYKQVNMNNVSVTLTLPQGMHAVGNPAQTTITQYIANIPYQQIATTDFQVAVDNTIFGSLPYTVVIQPSPGASKTINGTINVAATPVLQLLQGANLVASPWSYNDASWQSVLAPLTPITDYQTYTWDAAQQAYILQTGPARGIGTWIVANANDGFVQLQGSPKQPTDELLPATGAPNIQLQAGWNLIGNPYNYSFPLGQLVGVAAGTSTALTYAQLVSSNIFDGSFAYYDASNQTYSFLQASTDELLPNYGYWVYATTPITLNFPPIYDLFVRSPSPAVNTNQLFDHYKLQIAAKGAVAKDMNTFVALDTSVHPTLLSSRKAPVSPQRGAIRAFVTSQNVIPSIDTEDNQTLNVAGSAKRPLSPAEYAQMVHSTLGKQVFNYSVYATSKGPVDVSWPNLATLPKNLAVSVRDLANNETINARSSAGYAYYAENLQNPGDVNSIRTFQVTITPEGTVRQTISDVTTTIKNTGSTKQMKISFDCTTSGQGTLTVYQNGKLVGTVIQNMAITAGGNSVTWPMTLSNGQVIQSGSYVLEISALGEGGDTATKLVSLNL